MDYIPERMDSPFRFVLVTATRAEQLMRGARAKTVHKAKPTVQAMNEVSNELIAWDYGPSPEALAAEAESVTETVEIDGEAPAAASESA